MARDDADMLQILVRTACTVEVLSHKPGNVTPGSEFTDATVEDFLTSANVIAPILAETTTAGVGRTIYAAVRETRDAVGHNTNLGIILLLTPLCQVPLSQSLTAALPIVLEGLNVDDSRWAYRAIALANPGGIGEAAEQDIHDEPTNDLRSCMCLAAARDFIARQYCNGFADVLGDGLDWLEASERSVDHPSHRIAWLALKLMSHFGDSLISRKCGSILSRTVQQMAGSVLAAGWPRSAEGIRLFGEFDRFLRADGNRRNPGTTADMVAAIVFAGLREGRYVADEDLST